jgi:hypothetical protein
MKGTLCKNALQALATLSLSLLLAVGIAEISLRLYHFHKYGIGLLNDANHGLNSKDAKLGWRTSPNIHYRVSLKDALKKTYQVDVATDEHGFRSFGDIHSGKTKLFFVGDSFTAAVEISNDKTYYTQIGTMLGDVEVFAYGAGGYGSLQEFMILDQYLDLIKPDVIVWQFYENDFLDNDPDLDFLKFFYNTGTPRPYLDPAGNVANRYATYNNLFWALPAWIAENIRLLKILNTRFSLAINRRSKNGLVPKDIAQSAATREAFRRSESITRMIMEQVKWRAGKIPVYLFCITEKQPYYDTIRNICQSVGIRFIAGVPRGLSEHERERPRSTRAADGEHLNETGDRVVAERIVQALKEEGVVR